MARTDETPWQVLPLSSLRSPVVLVVDMINGFVKDGALADPAIQKAAKPIADLIEQTQAPAWFITDTHAEDAMEFENFPPHCLKGSEEAQVIDELIPYVKPDHIIEKNAISAIFAPDFGRMLESLPEETDLIVTGCCTDLCVEQLALPLLSWIRQNNQLKKRVIVPVNTVDTYHIEGVHDAKEWNRVALQSMAANGVMVVSAIEKDKE